MNDLENLLNLHGEAFLMDNGYWVKFEAYQVEITTSIPHGVRYSLTLHDKNNRRVVDLTDRKRQRVASSAVTNDVSHIRCV